MSTRPRLTVGELATLGERCLGGATPSPLMERAVAELVAAREAEALRDAADAGPSSTPTDQLWRMWLRNRAAALAHPSTDPSP